MKLVAGIDIGNATTETALARIEDGHAVFLASGTVPTTGIKGTRQNINGIFHSLTNALEKAGLELKELSEVRLNEAAPVIGDVAMETITETIITESTMIGHNPATPGGMGVGVGETVLITELEQAPVGRDYIAVVPGTVDFEVAARLINRATAGDRKVTAAIVQRDDGVLIHNRLTCKIPIVDEVALIDKVPIGMRSAVEVAAVGGVVEVLSNPYGIATLFGLSSDETRQVVPIASLGGPQPGRATPCPWPGRPPGAPGWRWESAWTDRRWFSPTQAGREQPLFRIPANSGMETVRALGANAARLVKKLPLKALDRR